MARYLLTHSLLSSWLYALKDNPYEDATTERDPMVEFMMTLRREPTPTTEAMLNGIEFENLVTDIANGEQVVKEEPGEINPVNGEVCWYKEYPRWYDGANKIAEIVRGGQFQFKARREVMVNGVLFLLHGRLDVLKAGNIDDIKFSKSYERGAYLTSTQHPMYFELIPEAVRFNYRISNGTEVWTESYTCEETPSILPVISDFVDWLTATGLMDTYKEYWEAK